MHRPDLGEPRTIEAIRKLHQCGPEAPVYVRQLAVDQPADEDLAGIGHLFQQPEDVLPLRMRPPASANPLSGDVVCGIGNNAFGGLKDDSLAFDPAEELARRHGVRSG